MGSMRSLLNRFWLKRGIRFGVQRMPKKSTVARECMWVPSMARALCYKCGTCFRNDKEKQNCRMCFDIFCVRCWGQCVVLPSDYGYTDPQPVCCTCSILTASFPTFAAQLHNKGLGQLLPPHHYVVVDADIGNTERNNRGWRAWLSGRSSETTASTALPLELTGWRPLNKDTSLAIGPQRIPLSNIRSVELSGDHVIITLIKGKKSIALVVGTLEGADGESSAFAVDRIACFNLSAGLNTLLKHCIDHFALSKASMALHPDLCPAVELTGVVRVTSPPPAPVA